MPEIPHRCRVCLEFNRPWSIFFAARRCVELVSMVTICDLRDSHAIAVSTNIKLVAHARYAIFQETRNDQQEHDLSVV